MNDEPPVTSSNRLHHVLIALEHLSHIPASVFALSIGLLAGAMGLLWDAATGSALHAWIAGGFYALAVLADWIWLAMLPRRGLSYGPVGPPLLGLIGLRLPVGLVPLLGCALRAPATACAIAAGLLHVLVSLVIVYATRIEPFRLGVTQIEVKTPKLPHGTRIRLVQVSDLHVERITRRERDLVEKVNALDADYVLLTGDYLSFSYVGEPRAIADARQVIGALEARQGIYAVRGTHQVDPNALLPVLLDGLAIRWLRSEHVTASQDGARITFAGASSTRVSEIDAPAVQRALDGTPEDVFTVLLYHTPERVEEALSGGADLYLSGHTHGGQIRLPLYGAVMTASDAGKRHEMGRYTVGGMTLYVSRGIGMEGKGAPRARFLCPPEVVCIDVIGEASTSRSS